MYRSGHRFFSTEVMELNIEKESLLLYLYKKKNVDTNKNLITKVVLDEIFITTAPSILPPKPLVFLTVQATPTLRIQNH